MSGVVKAMYAEVACVVWRVLWWSVVEIERVDAVRWRFPDGVILRAVDVWMEIWLMVSSSSVVVLRVMVWGSGPWVVGGS